MRKENIEIITQFALGFGAVSMSLIFLRAGQISFGKDAALIWGMGALLFPSMGMIVTSISRAIEKRRTSKNSKANKK